MRNAILVASLVLPSLAFAQTLTEHDTPLVLPLAGSHYETGAGAPSVVWDPSNSEFVMFFESRFGNWGDNAGCARAGNVFWGVTRATSPDGLAWTVDADPVLEPVPGTYYGCAATHPEVVYDGTQWDLFFNAYQEESACDITTPAWGCYEQVGVGHATSTDGINWTVDATPAVEVGDAFGYPSVAVLNGEWTMLLSNQGSLSRATSASASGPWTWDSTPVLSPGGLISAAEDEVFEPNLICEDYQPVELYFGGYDRNDLDPFGAPIEQTSMMYGTSADAGISWSVDLDPAVNPLSLWDNLAGDVPWKHWDVVRVGGQTLVFYATDVGAGNQIQLAYDGAGAPFDTSWHTTNVCWTDNYAPTADDDDYAVDENDTLTVAPEGVLGNDTDRENNLLIATIDTDVTDGLLVLNTDGSFEYTPNTDFTGVDGFTYVANDGTSDSTPAMVTIDVTSLNGTTGTTTTTGTPDTGDTGDTEGGKGCGCDATRSAMPAGLLGTLFLGLMAFRRRE